MIWIVDTEVLKSAMADKRILTPRQFSERCNVSESIIRRIVSGETTSPPLSVLAEMCDVLGIKDDVGTVQLQKVIKEVNSDKIL